MAWYNPTAPMSALQLALMNGRGLVPSKVQAEAPNAAQRLAQAMQQGGRRITGMGERDPKSGQMVAQTGPQAPVQMQDVQSSRYMADSLLQGQDPNPQSDLSGAANVARILGSALINRRANNQEDRVQETASNERRKALELALGGQRGGSNPQAVTPSDPALQVTGKSPTGERMSDADTMRNFAMSAQTPEVQQFAMGQVQEAQERDQERARLEQEAAALGMDPRQYAVLPDATRAELFNRRFAPEPQEAPDPVRGVNINGQLVNPVTGEIIGDFRTDEQRGSAGEGGGSQIRLSAEQMGRVAPNLGPLRTAQRQLEELEAQGVTFTSGGMRDSAATAIGGIPGFGMAERVLGTDDRDALVRASSAFEAAVLPILSGAAVTDSEAQRYIRAALPQPGDSPRVRQLKAIAREQQLQTWEAAASGRPIDLSSLDRMAMEIEQAMAAEQEQTAAQGSGGANDQPQEGQTATNPQTGERIVFRNGQWQPL